ncbi:hypothetical protein MSAN_01163500 [Mycena sanguinolenta]|uniref:Protein kinase domain-containing protein n=1 Tax=Mycena sanguinolenta TaxID=230812 RepID=A0A8H6YNX0_9AGAR|nr:hypothetical protein MSAN_01163500 [Mycena sanguinolenta]
MPRQAREFRTVKIHGGVGGKGGRGGKRGGNGGAGEGPTTHFGVVKANTMRLTIQNHNFHGRKRRREEIEGKCLPFHDIIRSEDLKLIREIGSGPGYLFHAGENKGHAVIVKVFNRGPSSTVRRQLESTVALSKGIMHPNLLRLLGISSRATLSHFIVYENVHRQNAEGPLAVALKNDLGRSITLGFKMVAGLSAGLNHLLVQGVFMRPMGVENFDIFLDVDDRFVICVHSQSREEGDMSESQEREGNAWSAFNALCHKTLTSANRALHHEEINRDPAIPDGTPPGPVSENPAVSSSSSGSVSSSQNIQDGFGVPPRREYVWRRMDRGQQSLENITHRINLDLDMDFSPLRRINQTDGRIPHRCAGYMREEITLATTIRDSAVVAHDAPGPSERCLICGEVVGLRERFRCECGDLVPGSRHTIKCQACKFWSHSDCVGNAKNGFTCWLCMGPEALDINDITTSGQLGGPGHSHGTGGPGGAGLGPTIHITAQRLHLHNLHTTLASDQTFLLTEIRAPPGFSSPSTSSKQYSITNIDTLGGLGGPGHSHGTGGSGGAGLGSTVNITVQQLTMQNLHTTLASEQTFPLTEILASPGSSSSSTFTLGGLGGPGHSHGTGGSGGAGLGSTVNINVQQLTMQNLHTTLASEQTFLLTEILASPGSSSSSTFTLGGLGGPGHSHGTGGSGGAGLGPTVYITTQELTVHNLDPANADAGGYFPAPQSPMSGLVSYLPLLAIWSAVPRPDQLGIPLPTGAPPPHTPLPPAPSPSPGPSSHRLGFSSSVCP